MKGKTLPWIPLAFLLIFPVAQAKEQDNTSVTGNTCEGLPLHVQSVAQGNDSTNGTKTIQKAVFCADKGGYRVSQQKSRYGTLGKGELDKDCQLVCSRHPCEIDDRLRLGWKVVSSTPKSTIASKLDLDGVIAEVLPEDRATCICEGTEYVIEKDVQQRHR